MKGVAAKLGVTIATLYRYVDYRNELYWLAVNEAISRIALPPDTGQHWSDFILDFADMTDRALLSEKYIVDRLIHWGIGLETELKISECFIAALARRGFQPHAATEILENVSIATFGIATRMHCEYERAARHGSLGNAIEEALEPFGPDAMPFVRQTQLSTSDEERSTRKLLHGMIVPLLEQPARVRARRCRSLCRSTPGNEAHDKR